MIKKVFLLLIFANDFSSSLLFPEECEPCIMKTELLIQEIKGMFQRIDPIVTDSCLPCKRCKLYGLFNFVLTPGTKVCTQTKGDRTENTFHITFEKIILDCICELECDPTKLIDVTLNANNTLATCLSDEELDSIINEKLQMKNLTLSANQILEQCISLPLVPKLSRSLSSILSTLKQSATVPVCPNGKATGNLMAVWKSLKISLTTVVSQKDDKVGLGSIIFENVNTEDLQVTCTGDLPIFNQSCNCVSASNFQKKIIIDLFQRVLPCYVNPEIDKYQSVLQYLKCEQQQPDY